METCGVQAVERKNCSFLTNNVLPVGIIVCLSYSQTGGRTKKFGWYGIV